jgi:glutaredoxin 3
MRRWVERRQKAFTAGRHMTGRSWVTTSGLGWRVLMTVRVGRAREGERSSGPMRFFDFGKKRVPDTTRSLAAPAGREEHPPHVPASREIVVYGTNDGARCRQVRALLEKRGYAYQDVRVDEDLSTRSWLQRTTGDDALPKVFVESECYGGFEDIQVLVFDGRFDRILRGEADLDNRVHLDLWYSGPPTKGGHRHGNVTVH